MSETEQTPSLQAPCTFILVRHGETASNVRNTFRGRTDVPLNETGLAQAQAVAARITQGWHPAALYASPINPLWAARSREAASLPHPLPTISISTSGSGLASFDEVKQRWPEELDNGSPTQAKRTYQAEKAWQRCISAPAMLYGSSRFAIPAKRLSWLGILS